MTAKQQEVPRVMTLFDLNLAGDLIATLPCGHRVAPPDHEEQEVVCLAGTCPMCGLEDGGYNVWLHHNRHGYAAQSADYCALQSHMFDARLSCAVCRACLFTCDTYPQSTRH